LHEYIDQPIASAAVKATLTRLVGLRAAVEEATNQLAGVSKHLSDVSTDQGRLRSNLQIIPQSSEHYKKFLEKFVSQESEIEALQRQSRQLQATLAQRQRVYQEYFATISAE